MIGLISGAFGLMAVATLWGIAFVSGFPIGPQILFLVGFGILVSTLVGTIAVALYRLWLRRKRKAEDRIITIAQGEVVKTLRVLLEHMKAQFPELEDDLMKALNEALDGMMEPLQVFLVSIASHTHSETGEAQFRSTKEVSDFLASVSGKKDSPLGAGE